MLDISQLQSQIKDLYREYGEFCYNSDRAGSYDETRKADLTSSIDACFAKISEIEAEIEAARQQAEADAAEKAERKRIEAEQKAAAAAAKAAAQQVPGYFPTQTPANETVFCTQCGAPSVKGTVFCGNCGQRLQ